MFEKCTCGYDGSPRLRWYYRNNHCYYAYRCGGCGLEAEGKTIEEADYNFNEKIKMRKASKKGNELHTHICKMIDPTLYELYNEPLPGKNLSDDTIDALRYCVNDILTTNILLEGFYNPNEIKKVIFNEPATIVFWADGDKTIVKCSDDEIFDPEKGLAMAVSKKMLGSTRIIDKWVRTYYNEEEEKEVTLNSAMESLRNFSIRLGGKNNGN